MALWRFFLAQIKLNLWDKRVNLWDKSKISNSDSQNVCFVSRKFDLCNNFDLIIWIFNSIISNLTFLSHNFSLLSHYFDFFAKKLSFIPKFWLFVSKFQPLLCSFAFSSRILTFHGQKKYLTKPSLFDCFLRCWKWASTVHTTHMFTRKYFPNESRM